MHKSVSVELRNLADRSWPEMNQFDILELQSSDIEFRVHDKWGRYSTLIMFD
jgi:hypothetical protein